MAMVLQPPGFNVDLVMKLRKCAFSGMRIYNHWPYRRSCHGPLKVFFSGHMILRPTNGTVELVMELRAFYGIWIHDLLAVLSIWNHGASNMCFLSLIIVFSFSTQHSQGDLLAVLSIRLWSFEDVISMASAPTTYWRDC